jgi:acyl-CoA dehydrogenase
LGGGAFPQEYESKLRTELSGQGFPDDSLIRTGTQVIGPTLLRMGTDHIRQQHLPNIHRGDDLVCQLFSEPDAGSDLANIKTVADEVAGGWKITGQKVWSSGSVHSDLGMCVARTERGSSRHAGLSVFLIDMSVPGVEVRKIRQMTGGAEFCEVFLTDVFVDLDHLIGEVGQGWKIVTDVLMNERSSIGGELLPAVEMLERLQNLYLNLSTSNAAIRDALAKVIINYRVSQMLTSRLKSKYGENEAPGPELAMTKLSITNVMMEMSSVASMLLGAKLIADNGEVGTYTWSEFVLGVPGIRIGGGTDEVLKNGIGERVLGLPRQ